MIERFYDPALPFGDHMNVNDERTCSIVATNVSYTNTEQRPRVPPYYNVKVGSFACANCEVVCGLSGLRDVVFRVGPLHPDQAWIPIIRTAAKAEFAKSAGDRCPPQ
jgi:hypothetical protein